jgi:4-hydroxy-tetrahydrodipicolinate reductase
MNVVGRHGDDELLKFSATWYCSTEIDADWDLRPGGWHVTVVGDCPLDMDLRLDIPLDRMAESTPGYTANRAVNAVPVVCQVAPGIRTTVDLPQIVADLGRGATP